MGNRRGRNGSLGGGASLYVTMAVAFMLIAVIVAMALFFKITDIVVEGAEKYSDAQVIEASGIEMDTSVFFISASSAEIAVKSALPYVDTVKVTRKLPGAVVISVTESTPAAYVTSGGKNYIVDAKGRVLEETSSTPSAAELRGVTPVSPEPGKALSLGEGESVRLTSAVDLMEFLEEDGLLDKTTSIDMTNMASVVVEYNGYRINIGTCDELDFKFNNLINDFLEKHPEPGNGKSVIYDDKIMGLHF